MGKGTNFKETFEILPLKLGGLSEHSVCVVDKHGCCSSIVGPPIRHAIYDIWRYALSTNNNNANTTIISPHVSSSSIKKKKKLNYTIQPRERERLVPITYVCVAGFWHGVCVDTTRVGGEQMWVGHGLGGVYRNDRAWASMESGLRMRNLIWGDGNGTVSAYY